MSDGWTNAYGPGAYAMFVRSGEVNHGLFINNKKIINRNLNQRS